MTWETLTGIVASRIETHLNTHNIMYLEQQGAMKNSYECKRQLFINKSIIEHAVKARRNLSMAFVDYQKAYASVPHDWILESLKIYDINSALIYFLAITMAN